MRDRRGLGRVTRGILASAAADAGFAVTLLVDGGADARALGREFPTLARASAHSAGKRGAYDLVWFPFNGVRYRAASPSLVTIADAFAFTEPHPARIARAREQAPIRRAARDATRVVTISQWSRREIARELEIAPARIAVVPLAPDGFWIPGRGDALPPGIDGSRFALVVGVREPRKNARLALEAFARAQRHRNELLVIVGELADGDMAFAKTLGVRAGTISPSDAVLRALYRNAVTVLVPSLAEGFGLVAVEALACGAAVLAADTAALPEATGDAALLLNPRDTVAWATAIRELFDDAARTSAMRARAASAFASCDRLAPARAMLGLFCETAAR